MHVATVTQKRQAGGPLALTFTTRLTNTASHTSHDICCHGNESAEATVTLPLLNALILSARHLLDFTVLYSWCGVATDFFLNIMAVMEEYWCNGCYAIPWKQRLKKKKYYFDLLFISQFL